MDIPYDISEKISNDGFAIINDVFTDQDIENLLLIISKADTNNPAFRKSKGLYAIRRFFKEVPTAVGIVFNDKLNSPISETFGNDYFVVKAIYFDKPEESNWFVAYHRDLTITVDKKIALNSYGPWTIKQDQFAVQPPLEILQDNFTIRIHLDNTNEQNGALKVIPGAHLKGIYRADKIDWSNETESICSVQKGGVMFMKPLLLHSSGRTLNNSKRRVLHIEFSRNFLPNDLNWAELLPFK